MIIGLILLLLSSSASALNIKHLDAPMTNMKTVATIELRQYDKLNMDRAIKKQYGYDKRALAFAVREQDKCTVHTRKIKDWNDNDMLKLLGHEVMHCFGANHE